MRLRTAVLTGLTGLMLNGTLASAQVIYREVPRARRYYVADNRWEVRQIVRQAYRDILRREPDASGMREYTNAMLHEGWSEADVRRSLANSREYRQRFGRSYGFWRYR
jgi:uncharacterized protein DUF4214